MKQLQNGIYTFNTGEKNWGEEANQNFEALDNLIGGVAGNNDKIELLSEKIQTNANNIKQTKNDLTDNITNTKNGLQDQIDILNNNILALKYKIDNMDIDVDSVKHAEEADVAMKLKKSLTIGNVSFNGEVDTVIAVDNEPTQDSSNLINSNAVYDALKLKQGKATTLGGYNITDAYTKSEIDTKLGEKSSTDHTHSNYITGVTKAMVTDALGYTPPTQDTTYSAGSNLSLSDTTFNVSDTPSFTSITISGYTITID